MCYIFQFFCKNWPKKIMKIKNASHGIACLRITKNFWLMFIHDPYVNMLPKFVKLSIEFPESYLSRSTWNKRYKNITLESWGGLNRIIKLKAGFLKNVAVFPPKIWKKIDEVYILVSKRNFWKVELDTNKLFQNNFWNLLW